MKTSKCCEASVTKQYAGNYFCNHCISICETKYNIKPLHIVFSLFVLLISISCYAPKDGAKKHIKKVFIDTCDIKLSDTCVYNELVAQGIIHPELVLSQAKLESGNYKSKVALQNFNIFGIKYIHRKPYQKGELNGHAIYRSYKECISDFKLTQQYYLKNIEDKYSETKGYSKLIKDI